jgi:hypothetical protein
MNEVTAGVKMAVFLVRKSRVFSGQLSGSSFCGSHTSSATVLAAAVTQLSHVAMKVSFRSVRKGIL